MIFQKILAGIGLIAIIIFFLAFMGIISPSEETSLEKSYNLEETIQKPKELLQSYEETHQESKETIDILEELNKYIDSEKDDWEEFKDINEKTSSHADTRVEKSSNLYDDMDYNLKWNQEYIFLVKEEIKFLEIYTDRLNAYLEFVITDEKILKENGIETFELKQSLRENIIQNNQFIESRESLIEIVEGTIEDLYSIKYLRESSTAEPIYATDNCFSVWDFHYNAQGDDNYNLNDEFVVLKNNCEYSINMGGWIIEDETTIHTYYLPEFNLGPGELFNLHTGKGTDKFVTNTAQLHWGRESGQYGAVWNNDGDTLFLLDSFDNLVLTHAYIGY